MKPKKTILIVDDTEMNRALLADILEDDYEISQAPNGKEAIDIIEKNYKSIDMVILDIVMPTMDGFDVLEAMHKQGWNKKIPVITSSAETNEDYRKKALKLGAKDDIKWPYDESDVKKKISRLIR